MKRFCKIAGATALAAFGSFSPSYATCSVTNTFANGTAADATQVNQNFTDLTSCVPSASYPYFYGTVGITDGAGGGWIYGQDVNHSIYFREGGVDLINYYEYGGTLSAGKGHKFYSGGLKPSQTLIAEFANDGVYLAANVGIGTTAPSYTLHVNGSVAGTSAYNNLSDERLKKNVAPIRDALSIIDKMHGVRFDWRSPGERSVGKSFNLAVGTPQVGFIAQDLEKALPEAVTTASENDHIKSVQESKVVPILVEAVKELQRDNRKQLAEISRLQALNYTNTALLRAQLRIVQQRIGIQTAQNR